MLAEPDNPIHVPIPVAVAKEIAEKFSKSIVIILAHDPQSGLLHTTTYGVDSQNKAWAARGGEITTQALGGVLEASIGYEDYRLAQAQKLLSALRDAIALANEAFSAWDEDKDSRVGKILRYLSDPRKRGYRKDIDQIHDAMAEAEKFLGIK